MAYIFEKNGSKRIFYNLENFSGIVEEGNKKEIYFGFGYIEIPTKLSIEKLLEKIEYINNWYKIISKKEFLEFLGE